MEAYRNFLDKHSKETDENERNEVHQVFASVAEKYLKYRPKYPEELITEAIQLSPLLHKTTGDQSPHILELGCGPATLTLPLLKRGFRVTAVDPGTGMIALAKEVCKEYVATNQVEFFESTFANFETDQKYDAIVAASSFHWVMAEPDPDAIRARLHSILKPQGTLILFWNGQPQLDQRIQDSVADALNQPKESGGEAAVKMFDERLLDPLVESKLFAPFTTRICSIDRAVDLEDYFEWLKTFSTCIRMSPEEQEEHFRKMASVLRNECDANNLLPTVVRSRVNVTTRVD